MYVVSHLVAFDPAFSPVQIILNRNALILPGFESSANLMHMLSVALSKSLASKMLFIWIKIDRRRLHCGSRADVMCEAEQ